MDHREPFLITNPVIKKDNQSDPVVVIWRCKRGERIQHQVSPNHDTVRSRVCAEPARPTESEPSLRPARHENGGRYCNAKSAWAYPIFRAEFHRRMCSIDVICDLIKTFQRMWGCICARLDQAPRSYPSARREEVSVCTLTLQISAIASRLCHHPLVY